MAESKNSILSARLYQGYDPNTEFKENGMIFSTARFSDNSNVQQRGLLEALKSTAAIIKGGFQSLTPSEAAPNNIVPQPSNLSGAPVTPASDAGNAYIDSLSASSSGGDTNSSPSGLRTQGAAPAASVTDHQSLPAVQSTGNSNNNESNTTVQNNQDPASPQLLAPDVNATGSITNEGDPIPLTITLTTDTQPGVTTIINVTGVPSDAILSAGIKNQDGTWTLTPAELTGLILYPEAHSSGEITLSVTAISSLDGMVAIDTANFKLTIEGDASTPVLSVSNSSGLEDTSIALSITSNLTDNDGSEVLSISITNVPAGAVLSAGTNNGNGSWTLSSAQLINLTLTPATNYSGLMQLNVIATATENGTTSTSSSSIFVNVFGVADVPTLNVIPASGNEHSPIALNISAALTDTDGSETLVVMVAGVPTGAVLSAGTDNGDGTWTLTTAQLANLTIAPPTNFSGTFTLDILAISHEGNSSAYANAQLGVTVSGVATTPILSVIPASGDEDTAIPLLISASLVDNDGSEVLAITITGVPLNATLSAGIDNSNGTWTLTPAQLTNLTITPPNNYSGSFNLSITATSSENATTAPITLQLPVTVAGIPDTPSLSVQAASGDENSAIALNINAALTDTDGSEILSVTISGVPVGATLSAGTNNGNGTWTLTQAQLTNLTLTPPQNFSGTINLGVIATAGENNLTASTASTSMSVEVSAIAHAPHLAVQASSGNEDTVIDLNIQATPFDNMGSEVLSVVISGVPAGAVLSAGIHNGNGSWTLTAAELANLKVTPALNYSGTLNFLVTLISTENSVSTQVSAPLSVAVAGVPDLPTLSVQPAAGNEHIAIALNIASALTDTDGSEILSITISGVPAGAILSAGTNNGGGTWTLTAAQLTNLTITPASNYSGSFNLGIVATASENNQSISTSSTSLSVSVAGTATAPTLVVGAATGAEDTAIALNITSALVDNDGSETLTITIAGVPLNAMLSAGIDNGNGSWTLTPLQLTNLTFTPPANFSGSFNLSVTSTSSENGTISPVVASLPVTITGVADTPNLSVQTVSGNEDTAIALNITASLNDTDGSEHLSILISGIPAGAALSAGLNNGDGTWSLTSGQLAGLTLTPPQNWAGVMALQVTALSTENNGLVASINAPLSVTIIPVADAPTLVVSAATGREDTAIALSIAPLLADVDNSETLSIRISGVPTGASLSTGVNNGGGTWTLTAAQLTNLKITPPLHSDADFTLSVTATATDSNGAVTSVISNLPVTVLANADIPTVTAVNTAGAINTQVAVNISGAVTDTDGSETLTYLISGVPDGFSLNHGSNNGNNTWTLTPADLSGLKLVSPYNFEGRVYLTAQSVSHDHDNSTAQSLAANFNVGVGNASGGTQLNLALNLGLGGIGLGTGVGLGVNLGSILSPNGIVVMEDSASLLPDAGLITTLASGISFLTFSGLPTGATLSAGTDLGGGSYKLVTADLAGLKLILPPNSDQDFNIVVTAKLLFLTVQLLDIPVHVVGVADLPTLSVAAATGNEDAASIPIAVTSALTDLDGSETLSFTIQGLPAGFMPTVGIDNGNGTWSLTAAQIGSLAIKPPANWSGDATYTIVATSTEREGDSSIHSVTGTIHVNAVADAPIITPVLQSGSEDTPLHLNFGISLADTDGSETISTITISNLAVGFSLTGATDNGNGTWSVNPAQINNVNLVAPPHWSGDTTYTVTATSREGANGPTASTTTTFNAHFEAVADTPNVTAHDSTGTENHAINLNLSASLNDTDGSEHLSIVIGNVPDHFIFNTRLNHGDGHWSFNANDLNNLTMTPDHDFTGDVHLSVDVFAQDSNNSIATTHTDFTVHVTPDT